MPTATPLGMGLLGARSIHGWVGLPAGFEIIPFIYWWCLIGPRTWPVPPQKEFDRRMNALVLASLLTGARRRQPLLVVGAAICCGALCMATKRNALGVLMGIELVLNGANLNFIASAAHI